MTCPAPNSLTVTLPWPPSANAYWRPSRGRGLVPSEEARRYKAAVAEIARTLALLPLTGRVRATINAYRPRKTGDLDNISKVLLDALSGWAWLDDSQVVELHLYRHDDASNPRVELVADGEGMATAEAAAADRQQRKERAARARATRNRNRKGAERALATPASYTPRIRT